MNYINNLNKFNQEQKEEIKYLIKNLQFLENDKLILPTYPIIKIDDDGYDIDIKKEKLKKTLIDIFTKKTKNITAHYVFRAGSQLAKQYGQDESFVTTINKGDSDEDKIINRLVIFYKECLSSRNLDCEEILNDELNKSILMMLEKKLFSIKMNQLENLIIDNINTEDNLNELCQIEEQNLKIKK